MQYRPLFALISRVRASANALIVSELEKAGIRGIAPSHGDILSQLFRQDARCMGELAARIRRSKSTVTTLVKKLEAQGYVVTAPSADDARATVVRLTPEGRQLQPVCDAVAEQLQRRITDRLSPEEADQLEVLLRKMLGDDGV